MKRKLRVRDYKAIGIVMLRTGVVMLTILGLAMIIADIISRHFANTSLLR